MLTLLRIPDVMSKTGMARPTLYARVKAGLLTPPVKLSKRASAWPADEIEAVNRARLTGQSDDNVRSLVADLIAKRSELTS